MELAASRFVSGCGLVTRPDGRQYAMVFGGLHDYDSSDILYLDTLELIQGKIIKNYL